MTRSDLDRLPHALAKACSDLVAEQTLGRYWEGCLSGSALSTATAISALAIARSMDPNEPPAGDYHEPIDCGIGWLAGHQNADGGWGDTDRSYSNISTTMLVRAAVVLAGRAAAWSDRLARANRYIEEQGGIAGLRRRYGRDKTFAVPILTNAALAGLVDWRQVPSLPFEAAWVPQRMYRWLHLPVVSYAIPALVAIGQARFHHRPPWFPLTRLLRRAAIQPTRRVLAQIQPGSGGYLEAVPLTSFVVMSLLSTGLTDHSVVRSGLKFIVDSVRPDGSWPIDTNLATWNTTLALNALAISGRDIVGQANLAWLLGCQYSDRHPYTGAEPGGWGWTDLSGAVPDADDTAGALLAIRHWHQSTSSSADERRRIEVSAAAGTNWLLNLQNADGGWPTFCRGWGTLPFDRSGSDLTAHAMRAIHVWRSLQPERIDRALQRAWRFLVRTQRSDGSWIPLWFGDQDDVGEENPVYGTAKVLLAFAEIPGAPRDALQHAIQWLIERQQPDGRWSHAASTHAGVEQTALALEALAASRNAFLIDHESLHTALQKGFSWLIEAVLTDRYRESSPIGFYFAKLWYYERLYPLTFTAAALARGVGHDAKRERPL